MGTEFDVWLGKPEVQEMVAELRKLHPDYDDGMIYQMAFMRLTPEGEAQDGNCN